MKYLDALRGAVRVMGLVFWTATLFLLYQAFALPGIFFPRIALIGRHWTRKLWARITARIIGMRIVVQGTPPQPPYYLVANHLSYVDGILLNALSGGLFVMMHEAATWRVIGWLLRGIHTIFVKRQLRAATGSVNEAVCRAMDRGEGLILFPEGRISLGESVLPFHSALLEPAIQAGMPVHYATIRYEAPDDPVPCLTWVCWTTPIPFGQHAMQLLRHRSFIATVTFGPAPMLVPDRKQLALQLHEAVERAFRPLS